MSESRAKDVLRRAAASYGSRNRLRKAEAVRAAIERFGCTTVLVIGVTDHHDEKTNIMENQLRRLPGVAVTFSGLARRVEGFDRYVAADGLHLPYEAGAFDMVVSNAVVEHVGDAAAQRRYMAEHDRVGRQWFTTTPNRAFPVESHYHGVASHWLPGWHDPTGDVTRLLTPRTFRDILPRGGLVHGHWLAPTLWAASWGPG